MDTSAARVDEDVDAQNEMHVQDTRLLERQVDLRLRSGEEDCGLLAAIALGDEARIADVIDRWGVDLAFSAHAAQMYDAARKLPVELAKGRRGLGFRFEDIGRLPIGTTRIALPRTAAEAEDEFTRNGDVLLRQAMLPLVTRRRLGMFDQALGVVRAATPLAEACVYPIYGDRGRILPYWHLQAGVTANVAGDLALAQQHYRTAWAYRDRDELGFVSAGCAGKLAIIDAILGNRTQSVEWLETAGAQLGRPDLWIDRYRESNLSATAAILAIDSLDADGEAVVGASQDPTQRVEHWPDLLWLHVSHALTRGDTGRARRHLDDTMSAKREALTQGGWAAGVIALTRAEIHLAMGRGTQAYAEIADAPDVVGLTQALRARTRLLTGETAAALEIVATMATEPTTSPRAWTEALLIRAAARLSDGDRTQAVADLRKAVARIAEAQTVRALATVPRRVLDELAADVPALPPLLELLDLRGVTDIYPESVEVVTVTERERDLLHELTSGRTLPEIARANFVSVNTIRTHLANLRRKLGATSRDEVLARARVLGLVDDPA